MKNSKNQRPLIISYVATTSLQPDPKNARSHPERQIEQIKGSIVEFGFTNPVLIDPKNNIIAGHGRVRAAKELEMKEVPSITLDGLTEIQKRALRLADNKIALNATWDKELLKGTLLELSLPDVEIDTSVTGFSIGEIDVVLNTQVDPDDEVIPAVPREPAIKLGDIWELGEHRVGCGDGRDLTFVQEVVGSRKAVDAAFLDPPYNVRVNGHANTKKHHREFVMASGEMSKNDFCHFLKDTLGTCREVSRHGAVHFVCLDWRHLDELSEAASTIYDKLLNICVWNKSNAGMGSLYRSKHEFVFVYRVGSEQHLNNVELGKHGRNRTNVWDYPSVNSLAGNRSEDLALHPTVKPCALVADAMLDVTRRGDLVLDVFLGSGTTLIAAEQTGRQFRGVELDPAYVDVALSRWSAITNKKPKLIERRDK